MIHKIHTAMEVLVYWAEQVTTPKRKQFQVCLLTTGQVVTKWSNANCQNSME